MSHGPEAPPVVQETAQKAKDDPARYLTVEIVGVYGHIGYAHLDLDEIARRIAERPTSNTNVGGVK